MGSPSELNPHGTDIVGMPQMLCGRVRRGISASFALCDSSDLDDILAYSGRRNCVSGREQDVVGLHRLRNGAVELGAGALCSDVAHRRGHSALFEASAHVGAEVVRARSRRLSRCISAASVSRIAPDMLMESLSAGNGAFLDLRA